MRTKTRTPPVSPISKEKPAHTLLYFPLILHRLSVPNLHKYETTYVLHSVHEKKNLQTAEMLMIHTSIPLHI